MTQILGEGMSVRVRYDLATRPKKIADCCEMRRVAKKMPKMTPIKEALFPINILRAKLIINLYTITI
jgi:hypothetical protein